MIQVKTLKLLTAKRSNKQDRERKVLIGLIDFYLQTGKPVGSNSLKEEGFEDLSSATIRNYFAALEEEGYLIQQHTSGGRIPTDKAFRLYGQTYIEEKDFQQVDLKLIDELNVIEGKEIATYLQKSAETLSELAACAVFLSAPRFDQDYVNDLKLISIDQNRCLGVIVSDFGVVQTEILPVEQKLNAFSLKRIENYFQWRLHGIQKSEGLTPEEERLGLNFYNELMLRYIVGYANFLNEDIHRTGFSRLLNYTEFKDPATLASSLGLFENAHSMRLMLRECAKLNCLKLWIGDDLNAYAPSKTNCVVLAIPYCINQRPVGAIGLLGPTRSHYRKLFSLLRTIADRISTTLTREVFKQKISFRQPQQLKTPHVVHGGKQLILLEDQRSE